MSSSQYHIAKNSSASDTTTTNNASESVRNRTDGNTASGFYWTVHVTDSTNLVSSSTNSIGTGPKPRFLVDLLNGERGIFYRNEPQFCVI